MQSFHQQAALDPAFRGSNFNLFRFDFRNPDYLIWMGFILTFVAVCRNLMFLVSVSRTVVLVTYVAFPLAFVCFAHAAWLLHRKHRIMSMMTRGHRIRVFIWFSLCVLYCIYGVCYGNPTMFIVKESLWFFMTVVFLIAGVNERIWYVLDKPATVVFYLSIIIFALTYDTISPVKDIVEGAQSLDGSRYTNTVGYLFRPFISMGAFLTVWGVVNSRNWKWRLAQGGALIFQLAANVLFFKFRSEAVYGIVVVVMLLFVRPLLERRLRFGVTALLSVSIVVAFLVAYQTEQFHGFIDRLFFHSADTGGGVTSSRDYEYQLYRSVVGNDFYIGRGIGGGFEAGRLFGSDHAHHWKTLHYGIMVFTLKGGVLMFLSFCSFVLAGLRIRSVNWYRNPCNLTAALLLPLFIFQFCMNPFALTPEHGCRYALIMMCLARFGRLYNRTH